MIPYKLLSTIRGYPRTVLLFVVMGLAGGAIVGQLRAQSHKAVAEVLASALAPATSDPAAQSVAMAPMLSPDYVSTQVDIINSDSVAARAAELLNLDTDASAMAAYRSAGENVPPNVYFGRKLHDKLRVVPSVGSRVISIGFSGTSGQAAADGANAFAKAYQDVSLDIAVNPLRQSDDWYHRNLDDLRRQLDDAQNKLIVRQRELGVTAPLTTSASSSSVEPEEARLTALSQGLAQAQAAQTAAQSRNGGAALPDTMLNPVVQGLDSDIMRLEGQRTEMATHLVPNALEMREIDGQIAGLQRERAKQVAMVSREVATAASQAGGNVHEMEGQLVAEKSRLIHSRIGRANLGLLQQDVDGLRRAYDELVARRANARLAGSGDQTNVAIISTASPQPEHGLVGVIIFALGGAFAGFLAGAILAVIGELVDPRIRAPEDVELLGIPNLGTVSFLPTGGLCSRFRLFSLKGQR